MFSCSFGHPSAAASSRLMDGNKIGAQYYFTVKLFSNVLVSKMELIDTCIIAIVSERDWNFIGNNVFDRF